jgi:hypothetical protein
MGYDAIEDAIDAEIERNNNIMGDAFEIARGVLSIEIHDDSKKFRMHRMESVMDMSRHLARCAAYARVGDTKRLEHTLRKYTITDQRLRRFARPADRHRMSSACRIINRAMEAFINTNPLRDDGDGDAGDEDESAVVGFSRVPE